MQNSPESGRFCPAGTFFRRYLALLNDIYFITCICNIQSCLNTRDTATDNQCIVLLQGFRPAAAVCSGLLCYCCSHQDHSFFVASSISFMDPGTMSLGCWQFLPCMGSVRLSQLLSGMLPHAYVGNRNRLPVLSAVFFFRSLLRSGALYPTSVSTYMIVFCVKTTPGSIRGHLYYSFFTSTVAVILLPQ